MSGTTFRLTLEYDGTAFSGWQRQPHARTVEGVLRDAVAVLTGAEPLALTAAGRTDAGAHAHGQVVGLTLCEDFPRESRSPLPGAKNLFFPHVREPEQFRRALNAQLPPDVVVVAASTVPNTFHARYDALTRTYRYIVVPRSTRTAVGRQYAWQVRGPLDVAAMRNAARLLTGTHDFAAFGRSPRSGGSTVRTVHAVDVRQVAITPRGSAILIDVDADAFLYGMMRSFAGALVAIGEGRMSERELHELVLQPPVRRAHLTVAPAHGLHQWAVTYPTGTRETQETR